ncbi:MAG TPA: hypothetical protein VGK89_08915 [Candidatus Eisenbacteria bacterium]|jgi:hypothetical protein
MRSGLVATLVPVALACAIGTSLAQAPRKDYIWARTTAGPLTLDGQLNEAAWAQADSMVIKFAQDAGIPGSGYFYEAGIAPSDPTNATLRFLAVGNQIWMGAYVRDKSIGGSNLFNRFDGFLMALKDHSTPQRPAPPLEYFYSWWYPEDSLAALMPGRLPNFRGRWTGCWDNPSNCTRDRTDEEIANWNAMTTVNGTTNNDATNDVAYTVEMRFNLTPLGYDITDTDGDAVEFNISIYDCDWFWPFQGLFSANRVWWEGPWGRDAFFHDVRILAKPSVTTSSGAAPVLEPDVRIPAADNFAAPTMDGLLTEPVWQAAPHFDIRYGDDALRAAYPGQGPWRSGQYQPPVNAGLAAVLDPGDATVRWFYKGNKLYLGFDVRDQVVQYINQSDRYDGFIVSLNDYSARGSENHQLVGYKLTFQVGPTGNALAQDELQPFINSGKAQVALALKPGTTLDTLGQSLDTGYSAEMWLDLTGFGYPSVTANGGTLASPGDGRIFLGIDLMDGDSFTPFTDSYGTRTWWQREFAGGSGAGGGGPDGPAWGYLDPNQQVTLDVGPGPVAAAVALLGNRPNPFQSKTSIFFTLPKPADVGLEVFDLLGRRVATRAYGRQAAGTAHVIFGDDRMKSGLYAYRLRVREEGGRESALTGRMLLRK